MTNEDITFFFIAQPGRLSLQARVLAASLRKFGPAGIKLRACTPEGADKLSETTINAFRHFDVDVVGFKPKLWQRFNYPIGNKLDAACTQFDTKYAVFLDTDMVALKPFDPAALCKKQLSARVIMGKQAFVADNAGALQEFISRALDKSLLQLTPQQKKTVCPADVGFPVYNSGLVAFETSSPMAERWRELTYKVLEDEKLPQDLKFPLADQTSLALTALEAGPQFQLIDKRWNSPQASGRAILFHYFGFFKLLTNPAGLSAVAKLHQEASTHDIELLGEISAKDLAYFKSLHGPSRKRGARRQQRVAE